MTRFGAGRKRGNLTPEDHQLIADAVRQGLRPEPIPRRSLFLHLTLAVVALAVAVWAYLALKEWRLPIELTLSGSVETIELLPSSDQSIHWHTKFHGSLDVVALAPAEPRYGDVEIVLPISSSKCMAVAAKLGGECTDGSIRIITGIKLVSSFDTPMFVRVRKWASAASLGAHIPTLSDSRNRLQAEISIQVRSDESIMLHLQPDVGGPGKLRATIYLQAFPFGEPHWVRVRFSGEKMWHIPVELRPVTPHSLELFIQSRPKPFELAALAPLQSIDNFSGVLTTSTGGRQVIDPPASLFLQALPEPELNLHVRGSSSLDGHLRVETAHAIQAVVDEAELVPSVWDRYSGVVVPIWSGLFGILVLSELANVFPGIWTRTASRPRKETSQEAGASTAGNSKSDPGDFGSH